ncbi:MAG: dihydropteroate synthase [Candidatus Omnitrophota bacterium]|nr:MAG: dihydropteroate synthase [Candidatus Omnitrophota bacterium]
MLIIGERINSSRKPVARAIVRKDEKFLIEQARLQIESGAHFIDINCAVSLEKEKEDLIWLIKTLQDNLRAPICIDSPNPEAIESALKIHKGKPFVNSITAETGKLKIMLGILKGKDAFAIGLTIDDSGIPRTSKRRVKIANDLVNFLKQDGIESDDIYIDPLVKPISSEPDQAKSFLEAVRMLKQSGIKTIGGLSNVSYGLPARRILNAVFLSLAIEAGIDAVIIDPVDEVVQSAIKAGDKSLPFQEESFKLAKQALLGEDAYCKDYIRAFREERLI